MNTSNNSLEKLSKRIAEFSKDRDWEQYHNPKNLSMALSIESSELMEIFQWLTNEQAQLENLSHNQIQTARDEIADVMIYTIRIAQVLNINLLDAIDKKIELNSKKYPIEKIEGKPSPK